MLWLVAVAWGRPLTIVDDGLVTTIDPVHMTAIAERHAASLVFDRIFVATKDGWTAPLLTSWNASADGGGIELVAREDVLWHDGVPFTAEDLCFSIGLAAWPPGEAPRCGVSGQTATVSFRRPQRDVRRALGVYVVPEHAYGTMGFTSHPVGTGPMRLLAEDRHVSRYRRWSHGSRRSPFRTIDQIGGLDPYVTVRTVLNGGADLYVGDGGVEADPTAVDSSLRAFDAEPGPWQPRQWLEIDVRTTGWTVEHDLRTAVTAAFDREGLAAITRWADTPLVDGPFHVGSPWADPDAHPPARRDRQAFLAAMARAGAELDTVWTRHGVPLTVWVGCAPEVDAVTSHLCSEVGHQMQAAGFAGAPADEASIRVLVRLATSDRDDDLRPVLEDVDDAAVQADLEAMSLAFDDASSQAIAHQLHRDLLASGTVVYLWAVPDRVLVHPGSSFPWSPITGFDDLTSWVRSRR